MPRKKLNFYKNIHHGIKFLLWSKKSAYFFLNNLNISTGHFLQMVWGSRNFFLVETFLHFQSTIFLPLGWIAKYFPEIK